MFSLVQRWTEILCHNNYLCSQVSEWLQSIDWEQSVVIHGKLKRSDLNIEYSKSVNFIRWSGGTLLKPLVWDILSRNEEEISRFTFKLLKSFRPGWIRWEHWASIVHAAIKTPTMLRTIPLYSPMSYQNDQRIDLIS